MVAVLRLVGTGATSFASPAAARVNCSEESDVCIVWERGFVAQYNFVYLEDRVTVPRRIIACWAAAELRQGAHVLRRQGPRHALYALRQIGIETGRACLETAGRPLNSCSTPEVAGQALAFRSLARSSL